MTESRRWGQGSNAATVLTNRAKHITVIDAYDSEKIRDSYAPGRKGSRHMHKTSFQLSTTKDVDPNMYQSLTSQCHSGRLDFPVPERPRPFPSQHDQHFPVVGLEGRTEYSTRVAIDFPTRDLSQTAVTHTEAGVLSKKQMAGDKVIEAMQHSDKTTFATQYNSTYKTLPCMSDTHPPSQKQLQHRDPITGIPEEGKSSNTALKQSRKTSIF
eukprot:m.81092 g.81092  ORF g.81092 m.81092 type:complete len:212 (+) comp36215_c0_seq3:35-670(+)